jgi:hypothetical protein
MEELICRGKETCRWLIKASQTMNININTPMKEIIEPIEETIFQVV